MSITDWGDVNVKKNIKDNYELYLVTGQVSEIKTLFEVIKDIVLEDINIVINNKFITIIKENSNKKSMIHAKLNFEEFEFHHIDEKYYINEGGEDLVIGVDSIKFFKIIKTAKTGDTIAFYIKKNQKKRIIVVRIENSNKKTVSEDELVILYFKETPTQMPEEVEYPGSIIISSKEFQQIFKNIKTKNPKSSNKNIEILHTGQQLKIIYNGDNKQTVTLGDANILKNGNDIYSNIESIHEFKNANTDIINSSGKKFKIEQSNNFEIIQGTYDLEYLLIFAKATNLSSIMLIRLQNDLPLILEYKIGVLGQLHMLLNPIELEENIM